MSVELARDVFVAALVVTVMLSVGFDLERKELREALGRPWRIAKGLTYDHAVVPVIAFGIALLVDAPPAGRLAVILCACTPGGPVGPAFVRKGSGDVPLAVTLVVLMAGINVITAPLTLTLFGYSADVPGGIARPLVQMIALYQLLPLALAMGIRSRAPSFAAKAAKVTTVLTNLIIALLVIGMSIARWQLVLAIDSRTLLAIVLTIVAAMGGAFALSRDPATRRALSLTSGVRNLSLGLLVASATFDDETLLAVMVYGLLMLVAVVIASVFFSRGPKLPAP